MPPVDTSIGAPEDKSANGSFAFHKRFPLINLQRCRIVEPVQSKLLYKKERGKTSLESSCVVTPVAQLLNSSKDFPSEAVGTPSRSFPSTASNRRSCNRKAELQNTGTILLVVLGVSSSGSRSIIKAGRES